MVAPPLEIGAVHVTVAAASPAVATTLVGAPGTVEQRTLEFGPISPEFKLAPRPDDN